MSSERPVWCAKCYLRVAPYDIRTVYNGSDYHQHCFLKLVREEAEEQKTRRYAKYVKKDVIAYPTR